MAGGCIFLTPQQVGDAGGIKVVSLGFAFTMYAQRLRALQALVFGLPFVVAKIYIPRPKVKI